MPVRPGLIPWGVNDSRGECFWVANHPDPDQWTIVDQVEDYSEDYDGSMTAFLVDVLQRRRDSCAIYVPLERPVYYYSPFEATTRIIRFSPTVQDHRSRAEIFRRIYPDIRHRGTVGNEDQFNLPPRGWFMSYKSRPIGTDPAGHTLYDHTLSAQLPEEDMPAARRLAQELADSMGVRIEAGPGDTSAPDQLPR